MTKKEAEISPDLMLLFDDRTQMEMLEHLVMEEDAGTDVYRAIWRRLFPKVIPPWIITDENREKLESPGPYAIAGLLTGSLCTVCGRPLYLTPNRKGVVCAGGHSEEQRKKRVKKSKKPVPAAAVDDDEFFD